MRRRRRNEWPWRGAMSGRSHAGSRRQVRAAVTVLVVATVGGWAAMPSQAMINGTADGNGHPNVGAVDAGPTGRRIPASGVLISPTVFLMAGHVGRFFTDAGLTEARVTFDPVFDADGGTFYTGDIHVNPRYTGQTNDQNDMAVIVFNEPVDGIAPARLPTANYLKTLTSQQLRLQSYPAVGYGISSVHGSHYDGGQPGFDRSSAGTRRVGIWSFMSLSKEWIRFDMGEQRACVGDSGAPNFLGSSDLVVGIGISGDFACEHMGSDIRVDTPATRSFLGNYVVLP